MPSSSLRSDFAFDFLDKTSEIVEYRYPVLTTRLGGSMLLVLISLLLACPPAYRLSGRVFSWADQALNWKLHHPLSVIPVTQFENPADQYHVGTADHLRKRTFRITVPVLCYTLNAGLNEAIDITFLSAGGFIVILYLLLREITGPVVGFLLGLAGSCAFLCQWGTNESFYFDGVGCLLVAAAAYTEIPFLIVLFLVLGGFSDERAILVVPLLYLLRSKQLSTIDWGAVKPNRHQTAILIGVGLFILLRIALDVYAGQSYDRGGVGFASVGPNAVRIAIAGAAVYKGTAIVMGFAVLVGLSLRLARPLLLVLLAALPILAGCLMVYDLCRSLTYAFPLLLISARLLAETVELRLLKRIAVCAALLSVLTPSYYFSPYGRLENMVPAIRLITAWRNNHWSLHWKPVKISN